MNEKRHSVTDGDVLPAGADIYQHIARRTRDIINGATVVVNSYDPKSDTVTVRAVLGMDAQLEAVIEMTGRRVHEWSGKPTESAKRGIASGKVHDVPEGLYDALFRELPRGLALLAQKRCDLPVIKGCGMVAGESVAGNVLFVPRGSNDPSAERELEAFLSDAAQELLSRQRGEREEPPR